jgi:histidyl-tRNA synthetase
LIALLIDTLRACGLTSDDFVVRLSSRNAWKEYFQRRGADPSCESVFYQAIDKLEREDSAQSDARLRPLGFTLEEVQEFIRRGEPTAELDSIQKDLVSRGLGDYVRIDYGVIRGLAYYTGPVFEAFDRKGEFRAIAGGGRYDNLVKLISGGKVDLPGLGFGMGDVVLVELLRARKRIPRFDVGVDVYCLIEEESLRPETLRLVQDLRSSGLAVDFCLTPLKADKQMRRALDSGATQMVCLTRTGDGLQVRLRDLRTREESTIPIAEFPRILPAPA